MVAAALGLALAATAATALAGQAYGLRIEVTAVRAAESGPSDPQLGGRMRAELRSLVGYRAFQIVNREERPCSWRTEARFALPGGRRLQLLPKGRDNDVVRMQVRLLEGRRRLVDTNVGVRNGRMMMFGVGRPGDDALIIVLKPEMDMVD
jgi:hypothetical protein